MSLHPVPPLFKVPDEKTDLEGGGDSLSLIDSGELDELELDKELEKELDEELEKEGESVEEESSNSNDATTVESNVEAQTLASDDLPNEGWYLARRDKTGANSVTSFWSSLVWKYCLNSERTSSQLFCDWSAYCC